MSENQTDAPLREMRAAVDTLRNDNARAPKPPFDKTHSIHVGCHTVNQVIAYIDLLEEEKRTLIPERNAARDDNASLTRALQGAADELANSHTSLRSEPLRAVLTESGADATSVDAELRELEQCLSGF